VDTFAKDEAAVDGSRQLSHVLPREGSEEFERRREDALQKVAAKFAFVAQQQGTVLRRNPLKQPPHKDYIYNRIAKAEYGFFYRDSSGKRRLWYPNFEEVFGLTVEGEVDFGILIAERIEFLPGKEEITHDEDACRVLNLWRPPPWKEHDNPEPGLFLDHLVYLFGDDQVAVDHVLDYLAHLVQRPWERIGHALLITSEAKGIGKSTFGNIVRRLVGEQNSRVAQTKDLKSQFDGWLAGKLVIQVEEVYEAGNWDLANKLKPLITERTVSVNLKYGPQMEIENYARFIMFSNHAAPLTIEDGDRRYFVVNSSVQPREDTYYEELNRFIDTDEGMNAIFSFLRRRDLSRFNPYRRPPMTKAKEAVIAVSGNPLRTYIIEAVESGYFRKALEGSTFSLDALQRILNRDGYGLHAKNLKELGEALKMAGVTQGRRTANGKKRRVYHLPGDHGWTTEDEDLAIEGQGDF
jgi:hypothetical protein